MINFQRFEWQSVPPAGIPFAPSKDFSRIIFTGKSSDYNVADTWYPSWASDGHLYSPYTDGSVQGLHSVSDSQGVRHNPATRLYPTASTGQAVMIGDDPMNLELRSLGVHFADSEPYVGRYPCGSLVHDGVWYYGTYCLNPAASTDYGGQAYNWPQLGPFVGFRISVNGGQTWMDCPHTPRQNIFGENGLCGQPVKIGSPHFVDFGRNMEYSPDGKAYLIAHGSDWKFYPVRNFAHLSWITGDQVYLLRVTPGLANINTAAAYEFYAGRDKAGNTCWTNDFTKIRPLLEWQDNMGCVTVTYNPPLKKYFLCVTDGGCTNAKMNTYILESDRLEGEWRLVTYMKDFGEQAYFVNFPSKFISADGRRMWICYSGNFWQKRNGVAIGENPPGSHYGLVLQEIEIA
jgi:hypothetical protein